MSDALLTIAGVSILAMMLHIVCDVMARQLTGIPIEGTLEFVANYYMVACVLLAMAAMQREGGQVVVEIFLKRLSSEQLKPFDAFGKALTLLYVTFLFVAGLDEAIDSMQQGAFVSLLTFDLPTWIGQWLVPVGFAGMIAVMLVPSQHANSTFNE